MKRIKLHYFLVLISLVTTMFAQIDVSIPENMSGEVGDVITIPINVTELDGQKISAFEMDISYTDCVKIIGYEETVITSSLVSIAYNNSKNNTTFLAGFGEQELKGEGVFLFIKVELIKEGLCNFVISNFYLNEIMYEVNPTLINIGNVGIDDNTILNGYNLHQNYPNPFNPTTHIKYTLTDHSNVNMKLFDIKGNEIKELINGRFGDGNYTTEWNATKYPSGIYFYQMIIKDDYGAEIFRDVKKMTLIK